MRIVGRGEDEGFMIEMNVHMFGCLMDGVTTLLLLLHCQVQY